MKKNLYERITKQILFNLEKAGTWKKLWDTPQPISLNNHEYRGINHLLLSCSGFESSVWGTFNQIRINGGKVNKGESSSLVVFWKRIIKQVTDPVTNELSQSVNYFLRYYLVFNTDQCTFDSLGKEKIQELSKAISTSVKERNVNAESILQNMKDAPAVLHGLYDTPCYAPFQDEVRMPKLDYFQNSEAYYTALFHELVHSTGHKKRLNRFESDQFVNRASYSKEELVAELGASYLMSIAGLDPDIENARAYIKGWLTVLQDNPTWITWAATRAQKACEFIVPVAENIIVES
ncbi:MAG: ArdC family protein [Bacteroidota bacterium]